MRARARITLVVVTLVTAALASLGLSSPASATRVPKVGQCHQLTWRQAGAVADTKKAVPCSSRHDLQTVAVVTSPTSLEGLTREEHAELGDKLCTPKVNRVLGRTPIARAVSAYRTFFFAPSEAQIAAGARWIRCDVAISRGRSLAPLTQRLHRPIIPAHRSDDVLRCLTGGHLSTTCESKHAYRPIAALRLAAGAYPTQDAFVATAAQGCPNRWRWATWGSPGDWAAGDRVIVCYAKSRR